METQKLGPIQEALIKARYKQAQERAKTLSAEDLKGWTNGAENVVDQQVMDSANPDLQDMSTDPADIKKKQLLAMKVHDQGIVKGLEKNEKEFMKSLPKVPWWKRFTY